ncbi:hypothetical protein [Bacillus solitudinis]|nr:hypothetical protein [Bacillus solitudinis]
MEKADGRVISDTNGEQAEEGLEYTPRASVFTKSNFFEILLPKLT